MTKLLNRYLANPTLANAGAIRAYDRKHPMAICLCDRVEADMIADAIHHANRGVK